MLYLLIWREFKNIQYFIMRNFFIQVSILLIKLIIGLLAIPTLVVVLAGLLVIGTVLTIGGVLCLLMYYVFSLLDKLEYYGRQDECDD